MSSSNCCFLTSIQISQEAGQVVWYSHLFKNFPQFVVIHTVRIFGVVNKVEADFFFSRILLIFLWSNGCWQFDVWFLCLQLEHLEVLGSCTLEAWLENFEHYFASLWDACNCAVVWTFFAITFSKICLLLFSLTIGSWIPIFFEHVGKIHHTTSFFLLHPELHTVVK